MTQNRREFVKLTGVFAVMASAGLISAKEAFAQQQAWNKAAFEAKVARRNSKGARRTSSDAKRGHFDHRAGHR